MNMQAERLVFILMTFVTTQKNCYKAVVVFGKMNSHELFVSRITEF